MERPDPGAGTRLTSTRSSPSRSVDVPADVVDVPSIAERLAQTGHALTVGDVARLLKVSDETVYRLIAAQMIPFFVVRGGYRFDPKAVAQWLRKRSVSAV